MPYLNLRQTKEERLRNQPDWVRRAVDLNTPYNSLVEYKDKPDIVNLVIEGGGVKGVAFVGAISQLEQSGELDSLQAVAGSSAGGIAATLLALGNNSSDIEKELVSMDLSEFFYESQNPWYNSLKHVANIKQIYRLLFSKRHGFSNGEKFLSWAEKIVEEATGNKDATFSDLAILASTHDRFKELKLTGTNITSKTLQRFDAENTPDVRIADALRITMSFPGAFTAYPLTINSKVQYFLDGGIACNFPMKYFDKKQYLPKGHGFNDAGMNPGTLGLKVDSKTEMETLLWGLMQHDNENNDLFSFISKVVGGLQIDDYSHDAGHRVIQIYDEGVKTLDFNLSEEDINKLIDSGQNAARNWISDYREESLYSIKSHPALSKKYQDKTYSEVAEIASGLECAYEILLEEQKDNPSEEIQKRMDSVTKELLFLSTTYNISVKGSAAIVLENKIEKEDLASLKAEILKNIREFREDLEIASTDDIGLTTTAEIMNLEKECQQKLLILDKNNLAIKGLINMVDKLNSILALEHHELEIQLNVMNSIYQYTDQILTRVEQTDTPINEIVLKARHDFESNQVGKFNLNKQATDALLETFDATTKNIVTALRGDKEISRQEIFHELNLGLMFINQTKLMNEKEQQALHTRRKNLYSEYIDNKRMIAKLDSLPFRSTSYCQIVALNNNLNRYLASNTSFLAKVTLKVANRLSIPNKFLPNKLVYLREVNAIKNDIKDFYEELNNNDRILSLVEKEIDFTKKFRMHQDSISTSKTIFWKSAKSDLDRILSGYKPSEYSDEPVFNPSPKKN